jgi:hypothetical protein
MKKASRLATQALLVSAALTLLLLGTAGTKVSRPRKPRLRSSNAAGDGFGKGSIEQLHGNQLVKELGRRESAQKQERRRLRAGDGPVERPLSYIADA